MNVGLETLLGKHKGLDMYSMVFRNIRLMVFRVGDTAGCLVSIMALAEVSQC